MGSPVPVVLDRALRILEAIISVRGGSSISTIAARLRVPAATAYRLCGALVARGYLVRVGAGRYYPGPAILTAGAERDARSMLTLAAEPCLEWVARRAQAAAHLGVFEDGMVSYLLKSASGRNSPFTRAGTQLDAYCSALGKVLLAHMPAHERDTYLSGGPFPRLTSQTIVDPKELAGQLRRVRRQSYAVDDREFADEIKCIAVPIRDRTSRVCAALSITAPPERLQGSRIAVALRLLRRGAAEIEARMQGRPRAPSIRLPRASPGRRRKSTRA